MHCCCTFNFIHRNQFQWDDLTDFVLWAPKCKTKERSRKEVDVSRLHTHTSFILHTIFGMVLGFQNVNEWSTCHRRQMENLANNITKKELQVVYVAAATKFEINQIKPTNCRSGKEMKRRKRNRMDEYNKNNDAHVVRMNSMYVI